MGLLGRRGSSCEYTLSFDGFIVLYFHFLSEIIGVAVVCCALAYLALGSVFRRVEVNEACLVLPFWPRFKTGARTFDSKMVIIIAITSPYCMGIGL